MSQIILKPIITEKMTAISEKLDRYGFMVKYNADKPEIKRAIEELYNVKVDQVWTMRYAGKRKSKFTKTGLVTGKTPAYKKALVTLKEGETIDIYSNI